MAQAEQSGAPMPRPAPVAPLTAATYPACGQPNAPDAARCANCWTALDRHPRNFALGHARGQHNRVRVLSPRGDSGLLTIAVEGMAPADVVAGLRDRNIFTRTIVVTKPHGVRLSIGAWNRESDLDTIAEAVEALAREGRGQPAAIGG